MKLRSLIPVIPFSIFLAVFSGCVVNDPEPAPEPPPCTSSPLCRLQNPQDTALLDSAQRANLAQRINTLDSSVVLFFSVSFTLENLQADTARFSLFEDLHVATDSSFFVTEPATPPDTVTILDWRGYALAPDTGIVDVTFHGTEFESGFARLNGKYLTFYALGGTAVLIADDSRMPVIECSPAMKPLAKRSDCLP